MDTRNSAARSSANAEARPAGDGERRFRLLALGQITSMLGTQVSATGVSFVAFLETGSVWWLSIIYLASRLPALVVSAHAGSLADRFDRRRILLIADGVAGCATALAAGLYVAGSLQLSHLVVLSLIGSIANAYQEPAFQAAVPTLVSGDRLDRANGLLQLGPAIAMLAGPAVAGGLVAWTGIGGVLILDLVTFAVAVVATVLVRFPTPEDDPAPRVSTVAALRASWAHLEGPRRGLRRLLVASTAANLVLSMVNVLLVSILIPLAGEGGTGVLLSLGGVTMLAVSALVSAVGLPERRVPVMGAALALVGVGLVLIGLRAHVVPVALGMVVTLGAVPVIGAATQTLYQSTIEASWQGRIAALRRVTAEALVPVGVLMAAPLVESLAEPAMAVDGPLSDTLGIVVGVGPGRGVGLVIVVIGLAVIALGITVARDRIAGEVDDFAISALSDNSETRSRDHETREPVPAT